MGEQLVGLRSIRPDPDTARSWMERELSRADYRQSLAERATAWLQHLWASLQASALGASPLSTGAAVLVVVVALVLLALVVGRLRREPGRLDPAAPLGPGQVSPQEHRMAAEAAMAAGDHHLAVVEGFRSLAARAVQRGVLEERPGRTAHELADDLGPVFPAYADQVARASTLFDLVFYGHPAATGSVGRLEAESVLRLDDALRAARPGPVTVDATRATPAVPR